ncbi:MAG: beta-glucuronidase [Bacteroidales bacterium]|nr:beta-glucuronidase [Bacteroidales bacterium]
MKRIALLSFFAFFSALTLSAQDETSEKQAVDREVLPMPYASISNVGGRVSTDLCGDWNAIVDQYDNGYYNYRMKPKKASSTFFADKHYYKTPEKHHIEYDFDCSDTLRVPGDWNTQKERLYYYEGSIWYRRTFDFTPKPGRRYFIHFGAVNYEAIVGLNGKILGRHRGGFTPFAFDVTGLLKETGNSLIVKVNNSRYKDAVPTNNCDWWNFGGITREVRLVEVPETFVREYSLSLSADMKRIEGWAQLDGSLKAGQKLTLSIPELKVKTNATTDGDGRAVFSLRARPELWSPSSPKLYDVSISSGEDAVAEKIGFRTISTDGTKLLLNGKPVFCKGIAIHEETVGEGCGRAWNAWHSRRLLMEAKELGCNFVRLAHYPHNENMTRIADSLGIMVWSEIPVYWTISWTNPDTYRNAENQLAEMIARDRNRASVVVWSVANETPRSEERAAFLGALIDKAREMDGARLVSAAMEKAPLGNYTYTVKDELLEKVDLISFNEYIGWYDGAPGKCLKAKWTFPVEKPVMVTELGAGVKYGYHAGKDIRFSEEYGVEVYKAQLEMLSRMPGLCGFCPWILKDFRSPRRQLHGIQDDFNRKGLISENGEKKDVWEVLHQWYLTK